MRFELARPADQKRSRHFGRGGSIKIQFPPVNYFSGNEICVRAQRDESNLSAGEKDGRRKILFWRFRPTLFSDSPFDSRRGSSQTPKSLAQPQVCMRFFTQLLIFLFQSTGNILNFCEVGLKISGKTPIVNQAVIQFPDTSLTSVTIATVERHTVAFLGTKDGRLKKVSCMQTCTFTTSV